MLRFETGTAEQSVILHSSAMLEESIFVAHSMQIDKSEGYLYHQPSFGFAEAENGKDQDWDCPSFVKAYPTQAIAAVNEVMFEQHGYQGIPAKEDPRYHLRLVSLDTVSVSLDGPFLEVIFKDMHTCAFIWKLPCHNMFWRDLDC